MNTGTNLPEINIQAKPTYYWVLLGIAVLGAAYLISKK